MRRTTTFFVCAITLLSASAAFGADAFLVTLSRTVSINGGTGFSQPPRLQPVQAGTQVMADEAGSGWIIYCGCDVEVRPGRVYTVKSPKCQVESVNIGQEGLPQIVRYPDNQREEEVTTKCGIPAAALLLGGAGVGLAGAAIGGAFDDDGGGRRRGPAKPASP